MTATLLDATGVQLAEVLPADPRRLPASTQLTFDGLGQPDGIYTIVLTAVDAGGVSVSEQLQIAITRTLGAAALSPAVLTPNGDGGADELTGELPARRSRRPCGCGCCATDKWVATPLHGAAPAGPAEPHLGRHQARRQTPDGSYTAVIEATDAVGTAIVSLAVPVGRAPAGDQARAPARCASGSPRRPR